MPIKVARVALRGPHDHVGAHRPPIGGHHPRRDADRAGVLHDGCSGTFHRIGQTAYKSSRVQSCSMGEKRAADHRCGGQVGASLVSAEESDVVVVETETSMEMLDLVTQASKMRAIAGESDRATFGVVAVDAQICTHPAHVVDRVEECPEHLPGSVITGSRLNAFGTGCQLTNTPPAIAAGGTETDLGGLDDEYPQTGIGRQ